MKKWILILALSMLALALLLSLSVQMRRAAAAEHDLREATLLALSEATEETQALALSMDKLRTAAPGQGAVYIREIAQHADRARHALATLPNEQAQLTPVLTWLSRLTTLAEEDLDLLMAGDAVDHADLLTLQAQVRLLHAELDLARQELLAGTSPSGQVLESALTAPPTAAELVTYRGLPSTVIGSGQALQIAKDFVGTDRVISVEHAPDVTGALPTFGVTVQTPDVQLNLEVTSRGGKVLLMVPETAGFRQRKSVAECRDAASAFLQDRGFASMEPTYHQVYDGLCVMTFVHVQEGVLIWPDRVVTQVRMDTGEVVGIEARSYWKNHTPRRIAAPLLTEKEARSVLSPEANVSSARLCLLPSGDQERLCWQFTLLQGGETYVSYIDAITGAELRLEKVMQLETGSIAA